MVIIPSVAIRVVVKNSRNISMTEAENGTMDPLTKWGVNGETSMSSRSVLQLYVVSSKVKSSECLDKILLRYTT